MKRKIWRSLAVVVAVVSISSVGLLRYSDQIQPQAEQAQHVVQSGTALETLEALAVKGRAPKTNYSREQFGDGWVSKAGCDMRNTILKRDLKNIVVNQKCQVTSGVLDDKYTGQTIQFTRGASTSSEVQIDHVVALSDAWQKGAQLLSQLERETLANDPLELLASSGAANQQKSDADAATWLPSNKAFRCEYVARQVAVKIKYKLWVTSSEKQAIQTVLRSCPDQKLPS